MTSLKGLETLESVKGSLTVAFNSRIKNLEGLAPEGASKSIIAWVVFVRACGMCVLACLECLDQGEQGVHILVWA